MTLEEEAEEYFDIDNGLYTAYAVEDKNYKFAPVVSRVKAVQFIRESKWIEIEKIKVEVRALESVLNSHNFNLSNDAVSDIEDSIKLLKRRSLRIKRNARR